MLDGFELAAGAWERAVLPARLDRYDPSMLDMLCLAGEVGWARLSSRSPTVGAAAARAGDAGRARSCASTRDAWQALRVRPTDRRAEPARATLRARCSRRCAARGASFFSDLAAGLRARRRRSSRQASARWSPPVSPPRTASPACARSSRPRAAGRRSRDRRAQLRRPLDRVADAPDERARPRATRRSRRRRGRCCAATASSSGGC